LRETAQAGGGAGEEGEAGSPAGQGDQCGTLSRDAGIVI